MLHKLLINGVLFNAMLIALTFGFQSSHAYGQADNTSTVPSEAVVAPEAADTAVSGGVPYSYNSYPCWMLGAKPGFVPNCGGGYRYVYPTSWDCILGPGDWCIDGWLDQGVTYGDKRTPKTFAPQVYNDMNNEYQMNQLYLSVERRVNENSGCMSIGGRVDLLYGTDYYYTQAWGLEARNTGYMTSVSNSPYEEINRWNASGSRHLARDVARYGLSLPQAYAEIYMPIFNGVKIKAGHFYSGMGLESPMAPENFFYSHSYTSYYGLPTTSTGALATFKINQCLDFLAGVNLGWNRAELKDGGDVSAVGGFQWTSWDKSLRAKFMVQSGKETLTYLDRTPPRYTVVNQNFGVTVMSSSVEWQINQCLGTSVEFVYGRDDKGDSPYASTMDHSSWTGVVNNWYWTFNQYTQLGVRAEWFRDNASAPRIMEVAANRNQGNYEVFDISLGLNITPCHWIMFRPEVRWDSANLDGSSADNTLFFGDKNKQFTFAIDALLRF